MQMWRQVGVRSWPSLAVVGPKGNLMLLVSGEGNKEVLDACITAALGFTRRNCSGTPGADVDREGQGRRLTPLRYPGKLAIDSKAGRRIATQTTTASS